MPSPVYTARLLTVDTVPFGLNDWPGPPDGIRWVCRSVSFFNLNFPISSGLQGMTLAFTDSGPWAGVSAPEAVGSSAFYWDGHQVVDNPNGFTTNALDDGWVLTISGYALSLP